MATIKPIEGRTIHQIQSGQVIVDLCSVVKELVENSLDAGAKSIDIRFKNNGLDSIEVQDNGDGISPQNYESLALKHHTSKLSTYTDLTTLQTFGFRGEALSSLCALSKFSVITCMPSDVPKGTKLEFEVSGKLKGTGIVAAQKGTTVCVENLFNNLPVRRRELERNIKREWNKVVGHLSHYACIQTGVKISATHQPAKGKKTTMFSTKGNATTRENIVQVFGTKTLAALLPMDLDLEMEPTSAPNQKWSTPEDEGVKKIKISGHISRPAHGEGRQTPDRQMFFVNARPCGLPQIAKAFNEVYRSYNSSQSPFIFANIELDTHLYDVNVSPDKRTILLHDQDKMLEQLKIELTALFESQDYRVPISQFPLQKQPSFKQLTISRQATAESEVTPSPAAASEDVESEAGPEENTTGQRRQSYNDDDDNDEYGDDASEMARKPNSNSAAVNRKSMVADAGAVSLISNWLGKKTDERGDVNAKDTREPASKRDIANDLSNNKMNLINQLSKESFSPLDDESEATEIIEDTPESTYKPPIQVVDFNRRMAETENDAVRHERDSSPQAPIPAVSVLKPSQTPGVLLPPSSRSLRSPATTATITIDGQTITSIMGSPYPKRQKTERSSTAGRSAAPQSIAAQNFGSRLSQRFSAPGTQADDSCEEDVEGEEYSGGRPSSGSSEVSLARDGHETDSNHEELAIHDAVETEAVEEMEDNEDCEYINEDEKKAREEANVQRMIQAAEEAAQLPSQDNVKRVNGLLRGGVRAKTSTVHLIRSINTDLEAIQQQMQVMEQSLQNYEVSKRETKPNSEDINAANAEERLSLTISKEDFAKMKIIGQFNLGFILATRGKSDGKESATTSDDLFIIDQHASDEKYNFERLQETTVVASQRSVLPKILDLTAMEEEIVMENLPVFERNGFVVLADITGEAPIGQRCHLLSLPLSREKVFDLTDLEELISLLADHHGVASEKHVLRPSKVRKMFAMRACRSSIMIGKTLTHAQMAKVVGHMGELDKPWNCPHGRPTMRHLAGLAQWDEWEWKEGDGLDGERSKTDWAGFVRESRSDPEANMAV